MGRHSLMELRLVEDSDLGASVLRTGVGVCGVEGVVRHVQGSQRKRERSHDTGRAWAKDRVFI